MSEKYSARELAFQYIARLPEDLDEERYLQKLIEVEARFAVLLTTAKKATFDENIIRGVEAAG